jgi:hypothetical protein
MPATAGTYRVLGPKAVGVEWQLGDGSRLALIANFGDGRVAGNLPAGRLVYSSTDPGAPFSSAFFLNEPNANATDPQ